MFKNAISSNDHIVIKDFLSVSLFPEVLDLSDAYEGGRFSLKLDRDKARKVLLAAFDGEA
jgi:hypothetical protein